MNTFSGQVFSKFTPLAYLLQNGFTLEVLDGNQMKQVTTIAPTPLTEAVVDEVHDKIKVGFYTAYNGIM